MHISIASVLSASLLDSVLLLGLCLLFKRVRMVRNIGPKLVIGGMLIAVIRMFFPIEFAFTHNIFIEDWFMSVKRGLRYILFDGEHEVKVYHILLLLWTGGAIVGFGRKIYRYKRLVHCISNLPECSWEEIKDTYQFDYAKYPEWKKAKVVRYHGYQTPYLIGYKEIYIVLPLTEYNTEQMHYILLHELLHIRNRDALWKLLIDVLCTAFWWNPIFRYVRKELFSLIELRNDQEIASMVSDREKVVYMQALTETAANLIGKDVAFEVAFSGGGGEFLKKRLLLLADGEKTSRLAQTVLVLTLAGLLAGSFAIIIEPYSIEKVEEEIEAEGGVWLTKDNTFLIKNGEEYDVYVEGEFLFTTDDLRPFSDVKIYNSMEEYEEEIHEK